MIRQILDLLSIDEFYGQGKNIDIAKGVNEYTNSGKKLYKQELRKRWQKRK